MLTICVVLGKVSRTNNLRKWSRNEVENVKDKARSRKLEVPLNECVLLRRFLSPPYLQICQDRHPLGGPSKIWRFTETGTPGQQACPNRQIQLKNSRKNPVIVNVQRPAYHSQYHQIEFPFMTRKRNEGALLRVLLWARTRLTTGVVIEIPMNEQAAGTQEESSWISVPLHVVETPEVEVLIEAGGDCPMTGTVSTSAIPVEVLGEVLTERRGA